MVEPKTRLSDYLKYTEELNPIENLLATGAITSEEFLKQEAELKKRYAGMVFPEDTFMFDEYDAFAKFLIRECGGGPLEEAREMMRELRHEGRHGRKAEEKGMKYQYGCTLMINDVSGTRPEHLTAAPFVMLIKPDTKDAKDVADVDDPSERDKELGDLL